MDRPTTVTYSDSTATLGYSYDGDGNVTQTTVATTATTYGRDALGRTTSKVGPTATLGYTYDLASNLATVTDAGGTSTYHYDKRNQVDQILEFSHSNPTNGMANGTTTSPLNQTWREP